MPNWCDNKLSIENPSAELIEYLKKEGFSFEKMAPPNRPESDENGFATVDAQAAAWGTKWDLDESDQKEVADSLIENGVATFDTAWSPPTEAIMALSSLFPEDSFTLAFFESGCWFWGVEFFEDGLASGDSCASGGTPSEAVDFLVKHMGYDEQDAAEFVGLGDDEEDDESES
jgi:hypothetical protein